MAVEILKMADELDEAAKKFNERYGDKIEAVMDAAISLGRSWSGSNLGYHALVYYEGLQPRPPGAQFSTEWGLQEMSFARLGSRGDWREFAPEYIKSAIFEKAGNPDLTSARRESEILAEKVIKLKDDVISNLSIELEKNKDSFIEKLYAEAEEIHMLSARLIAQTMMPRGQMISRDTNAISAGLHLAPHQEIIAEIMAITVPVDKAVELSSIARKAGSHIERKVKSLQRENRVGTNVFIGHGRSPLWRELKDFVVDRLQLPYEEFNRVPVAGVTNIARLSEMLDGAGLALVVLTAEDEQADGAMRARMNVIHEVGLFQGRLGFTKAIVILEHGCEEFSNIQGLGQIRFPTGNIKAAFEEIRAVMEREGMI